MQRLTVKAWGWVTADTLDFGACLFRCVLMGQLREHSFELKGYLLRTNIIPHFIGGRSRLLFVQIQLMCGAARINAIS